MKRMQRIISLLLVLVMTFQLNGIHTLDLHAEESDLLQHQYIEINPLYEDIISESDIPNSRPLLLADEETDPEYYAPEKAGEIIRESLKQRVETFAVNSYIKYTSQDDLDLLAHSIVTHATAHTGNPTEGDYLYWQFGAYKADIRGKNSGGTAYVTITYTFTYYTTAEQEAELDAAVDALLEGWNVSADDAKLHTIYDYICSNVTYDTAHQGDDSYKLKHTAYAALINKTAVCQGYATLLYRLALELGVDCRLIAGEANGAHGWNIAKIDGLYYNLDATWDAGEKEYKYFLVSPESFTSHVRYAEYDTEEFHAAYPMSESNYNYCEHTFTDPTFVWAEDHTCKAEYGCKHCDRTWSEDCEMTIKVLEELSCTQDSKIQYTATFVMDDTEYFETKQVITPAPGHTTEILPAIEATCTTDGITEGLKCTVCGEILLAQEVIPATGHTLQDVKGHAATCTEDGLTDGVICTVCNEMITKQEIIPSPGHQYEDGTCTVCGTVLQAPKLTLTNDAATGSIVIQWTADEGVDHYEVYRSDHEMGTYVLEGTVTAPEYTDTKALAGETYYYYIIAVYKDIKSAGSNIVHGTADCAQPVVTAKVNTATGKTELMWAAVEGAVRYEVAVSSTTSTYNATFITEGSSFPHTAGNPGETYLYKVTALAADPVANSAASQPVTSTGICAQPLVTISNIASTGKIKLSWDSVLGAASYEIYRSTEPDTGYELLTQTTLVQYIDSSAVAGTTYYYGVRAISEKEGANSIYSVMLSLTCDLEQPVITLSNVASSGKVKISWNAIEGAAKYKVYRSTEKDGDYILLKTLTGTSMTNLNGKANQYYYYKVIAIAENTAANSAYSEIKGRTVDLQQPTITLTNDAESGKVKISWDAVEGAAKYKVYRSTEKDGKYTLMKTVTDTSMINWNGAAGKYYYYKVRAISDNTNAHSAYSAIKGRTCDLAAPTGLSISRNSDGKPVLTWDAVEGAVKYKVYRSTSKNGEYSVIATVTGTRQINKKAEAGKTYYYKVKAIHSNTNAHSAFSAVRSIKAR